MEAWRQWLEEGKRWHQAGQGAKAASCYERVLAAAPEEPETLRLYGVLLCQGGRLEQGVQSFLKAAESFSAAGNWDMAAHCLEQVLLAKPQSVEGHFYLARVRERQGDVAGAQNLLHTLVEHVPQVAEAWAELAFLAFRSQNPSLAETHLRRFVTLRPQEAQGWSNLGIALQQQGRLTEAAEAYERALLLHPDDAQAHLNRAVLWLYQGDWEKGFQEYEWRLQREARRREMAWCASLPRWQGELFSGKRLLVHHEQGFGDALQFCRYLPSVKARGGWVTLSTKKELVPLLQETAGADEVVEQRPGMDAAHYDVYVPLLSLPLLFGTTVRTIPAFSPYLSIPPQRRAVWQERIAKVRQQGLYKVGLLWSGARYGGWEDYQRSSSLQDWLSLKDIPGVEYYRLQLGEDGEQHRQLNWPMQDLTEFVENFADTAALLDELDLVVTVDTAMAHVAGGLGKEVWLLLPHMADWRWLADGETTRWYPQARLFRQTSSGDWKSVIEGVASALRQRLQTRGANTQGKGGGV